MSYPGARLQGMTALDRFSAPTRSWFEASFASPTPAQEGAWDAIAAGRHALVVAPTGSGKTLSAFLHAIDRLLSTERPDDKSTRTRVLYISPLKALGVDVERNLRAPLTGIRNTAERLETSVPDVTVGLRSGDTTPAERRRLGTTPPDILITTPESLFLMLTSQARETLRGVDTVIIDEVHAVAGTKRGAHLGISLERLDHLLERPAQRIGLSATVRPLEEVARFLGGTQPVEIVAPPSAKEWDLRVVVPVEDMTMPEAQAAAFAETETTHAAAAVVEAFLEASMVPDPQTAARYIADDLKITFTGGRKYRHPRETTAFNAKRYKWVKKAMERSDVVPGRGETVVYNIGTLYGEWPDGTPFEGNRYVDRFVVRGGKIVQMDVWNDSAERILTSRGIEA